jgi:hypothetical protein
MSRWGSIAVSALALGLLDGCGPVFRTADRVQTALVKAEWAMMPNRLEYSVYQPSHRIALSTSEVLKAELAEFKIRKIELTRDSNFDTPEGKPPELGSFEIPKGHSACWFEGLPDSKAPMLVNCRLVSFSGKSKAGEKVDGEVRLEVHGSDQSTVVSVQVGGRGDATRTKQLIDRITERVQNPSTSPGSPEESAALKALFDLGPKSKVDFSASTGEITIKAD